MREIAKEDASLAHHYLSTTIEAYEIQAKRWPKLYGEGTPYAAIIAAYKIVLKILEGKATL